MSILSAIVTIALGAAFLLAFGLLVQVVAAYFYRPQLLTEGQVNAAVLVPAHNEALGIATTLEPLRGQRVLVVADNCNDDTAQIARECGAEVIERSDAMQRGKGYALDFGLQHLKQNPPQVVVILDADCQTSTQYVSALASACREVGRPVQALYLMESPPDAGLKVQISAFAWRVKNWARPLGMYVLGLPCQLMGTGMAFLWDDLQKVSLASGHIVEDMKLGADLAALGKPPLFLPQVQVISRFPIDRQASAGQRMRWEHGHLSVILSEFPKLFRQALTTGNLPLLAMALDLAIPPLALLCLLGGALSVVGLSIMGIKVLSGLFFASIVAAVLLAWWRFGRDILSFRMLCFAPFYALGKIPLYLKFLVARQAEWVRSKRD